MSVDECLYVSEKTKLGWKAIIKTLYASIKR